MLLPFSLPYGAVTIQVEIKATFNITVAKGN
jgi:hypothetical protein